MVDFISFDIYEQKLYIIATETQIIKDVTNLILSYDCVVLKPGSLVNCVDEPGKMYLSTVLMTSTNTALVHYNGWNIKYNEEIEFCAEQPRLSMPNRDQVIQSHFKIIQARNECTIEQYWQIIQSLENEGFCLNRILSSMYVYQPFTLESVRECYHDRVL
jgi:hypothetical protein